MRGMPEKSMNLVELCARLAVRVEPKSYRAALLGGKVSSFVMDWAAMMRETGNEAPTLEDWREWANRSERTAFQRLADFRLLFGEWYDMPTVLARQVNRARDGAESRASIPASLVPVA